jgi:hypothetical protein
MAADRFHPGREQYREWAQRISDRIIELAVPREASPR